MIKSQRTTQRIQEEFTVCQNKTFSATSTNYRRLDCADLAIIPADASGDPRATATNVLRSSLLQLHPALATPALVRQPDSSSLRTAVSRIRRPAVVIDLAAAVAELASLQTAAQELTSAAKACALSPPHTHPCPCK